MRNIKSAINPLYLNLQTQKGIYRMNILTQKQSENQELLRRVMDRIMSPLDLTPGVANYIALIETIGKAMHETILEMLKECIEKMDYEYRDSISRKQRYYVKQTRARTIVTVCGVLTFTRTEYQHKLYKDSFCYVDWKLGLEKRKRFDPCIRILVREMYANNNSMIKVGQLIGDRISGLFNCDPNRITTISRQSVFNMLKEITSVSVPIIPAKSTPEILYIMADEKFIPIQGSQTKREMVKLAVIFEANQPVKLKNGLNTRRNQLINKTCITNAKQNFWEKVDEVLHQKYEMDKVKHIVLMGDGAGWIKNGAGTLRQPGTKVTFAIDSFHFNQAINRITSEVTTYSILANYSYHNMKDEFIRIVDSIIEANPERACSIEENKKYLIKHWTAHQTTLRQVKTGCAMEQAVSHMLASQFTSVPKAYGKGNLPTYLNLRELYLNGYDLRNTFIKALSLKSQDNLDIVIPAHEFDFSIFEKKQYRTKIDFINKNVWTLF